MKMKAAQRDDATPMDETLKAPETAADMRRLLGTAAVDLLGGRLDVRAARALGLVAGGFLKTVDIAELEERVRKVEEAVAAGPESSEQTNHLGRTQREGENDESFSESTD
jgi:hypothetical protein